MKIINREILPFQEDDFFSPLRDKIDYARLVIFATRYLLLNIDTSASNCKCKLKICVDKMSRLFFYREDKFFSVAFPFSVITEGDEIVEISSFSGISIDSKALSSVLSILEDSSFKLNPSVTDYYIESNTVETIGISLLEEIFQSEPSYIRYDYDPKYENGRLHPLHHIDINYSSYGTFKLGLNSSITTNYFDNILNLNTDCSYLKD